MRNKIIITILFLLSLGGIASAQAIDPDQGGTGIDTYVAGDLIYASTTLILETLPVGSNDQVLTLSGGFPVWSAAGSGSGDVTAVGDCASGACLDGTSDGGTFIRLYDGNSDYTELLSANVSANTFITFPSLASTTLIAAQNNLSDLSSTSTAVGFLGLTIGADTQAWDDDLDDLAALTPTKGDILTTAGTNWTDLAVGSNGTVLVASSTNANGIVWSNVTTITDVGALDIGSITSGFGAIDIGSSNFTTTGTIAGITAANLVDKSASEAITGAIWTFGNASGEGIEVGSTGVRLTSDQDGAITLLSISAGSQEDVTINLDDTANTAVLTSSTGLNKFDFAAIGLELDANINITLGAQTLDHDGTNFVFNDQVSLTGIVLSGDTITDFQGDSTISVVSNALRVVDITCTNCINATEIEDIYALQANNLLDLSSTSTAISNLGLTIGADTQAWDTDLDTFAGLDKTSGNLITASSSAWMVVPTGTSGNFLVASSTANSGYDFIAVTAAAAASTSVDSLADPGIDFTIEFKSFDGTIDTTGASSTLKIDGGAGTVLINSLTLTSSSTLLADLGLTIGTDTQAWDAELDTIAALTETNGNVMFVAGGAWTSDATPAIDCTDCTNLPAASAASTSIDSLKDPKIDFTLEFASFDLTFDSTGASSTFVIDGGAGFVGVEELKVLGGTATFGDGSASATLNFDNDGGTDGLIEWDEINDEFDISNTIHIEVAATPLTVHNTTDAADNEVFHIRGNTRATAADDDKAHLELELTDSAGNEQEFVRLEWIGLDVTDGSEDGSITFSTQHDGTMTEILDLHGVEMGQDITVFNRGNNDVDFRIEGDTVQSLFYLNANLDSIGIGTSTPVTILTIDGTITLAEQAEADADTAGYGQIWVNTATPNELFFTDDAGTDVQLGVAAAAASTTFDVIEDVGADFTIEFKSFDTTWDTTGASSTFVVDGGAGFVSIPDLRFGAAGVKITGDGDGAFTWLGLGDGNDEDLTWNLDDTANTVVITTSTGVTALDWTAIGHTTGGIIRLDIDGSALNAAGSINFGLATTDSGIFFDGSNLRIETQTASGIILDSEDDTLEFLGSGVLQATLDLDGIDLITGNDYEINGASVLTATTLGGAVVNSSLTSLGTIATGVWEGTAIAAGFYAAGSIDGDDINSNFAGAYITETAGSPDVLDLDTEVVERTGQIHFGEAGFVASSTQFLRVDNAITLQEFGCFSSDDASGTVAVEVRSINTPTTASTTNILSAELESGGGGMASTTSFTNTVIDANQILAVILVDASSTTAESFDCYLDIKVND